LSEIRVTYSGLISFFIGLVGVVTGLILILIITRTLTSEEYGTWSLILGLIAYGLVAEQIISFWSTREMARGLDSAKTAILFNGFFSVGGIFIYVIISYFVGIELNIEQNILLFASVLIPVMFLNNVLSAINLGWKPQGVSYGFVLSEITKIPAALFFVYFLDAGVMGIIIAFFLGNLASLIFQIFYARNQIKNKIKIKYIKKWIKLSWIPLYPEISEKMFILDVIVFPLIVHSVNGLAFFAAAMTIAGLVGQTRLITRAIYPKLLQDGKSNYLQENITHLFYFAIPITALSITFAKSGLFALNPIYASAVFVVMFLSLRMFFHTINQVFCASIEGIENVDKNIKSTFKDYMKSKLFFMPTIRLIQNIIYIGTLIIVLLILRNDLSEIELVTLWSLIALLTTIPFSIYYYILARQKFELKFDLKRILKYFLVSVGVFGTILILQNQFLEFNNNIFEFIPSLLVFALLGVSGYVLITYLIDGHTQKLFKSIFQEIYKKSN
jgi:O-antigen/teichoic acid export membrane protein